MKANFERIFGWVLIHEGGYSNHPKDPGGATNQGVTQRVYTAYRKRQGLASRSVRHIEKDEVRDIYRIQYWDRLQCNSLPAGLDYAVYDFGVNSGVSRAAKYLQAVLGVEADGDIGQMTLAAIEGSNVEDLIVALCAKRMAFLRKLKTWATFGRGWSRRVEGDKAGFQSDDVGVLDRAVMLARGAAVIPAPQEREDGAGAKSNGEKTVTATVKEMIGDKGSSMPVILTAAGSLFAAVSEPPMVYFVGAALVMAVAGAMYLLARRNT